MPTSLGNTSFVVSTKSKPDGLNQRFPYGINGKGEVVGVSNPSGRVFVYAAGQMIDLGQLGFDPVAINDNGEIAGNVMRQPIHGVFYKSDPSYKGGTLYQIPTLGGAENHVYSMNNKGVVVGGSDVPPVGSFPRIFDSWNAFSWTLGQQPVNLGITKIIPRILVIAKH